MSRLQYLARSTRHLLQPERLACPNCGGEGVVVERKYLVTALRRCANCRLLYRTPTDSAAEAETFYNEDYVQGATTSVPSLEQLEDMKRDGFAELECDYTAFASVLRDLGVPNGAKVFDYGCSWGYGSYIFRNSGFEVKSFEISRPRGRFGRDNLGVDLVDDFDAFVAANPGSFDVFFSSHVLEHVPSPSTIIGQGLDLLRSGGLFVAFLPNGSEDHRRTMPENWNRMWGEVHPNYLDDTFFAAEMSGRPYVLGTSPIAITPAVREFLDAGRPDELRLGKLSGEELFVAARKLAS